MGRGNDYRDSGCTDTEATADEVSASRVVETGVSYDKNWRPVPLRTE